MTLEGFSKWLIRESPPFWESSHEEHCTVEWGCHWSSAVRGCLLITHHCCLLKDKVPQPRTNPSLKEEGWYSAEYLRSLRGEPLAKAGADPERSSSACALRWQCPRRRAGRTRWQRMMECVPALSAAAGHCLATWEQPGPSANGFQVCRPGPVRAVKELVLGTRRGPPGCQVKHKWGLV